MHAWLGATQARGAGHCLSESALVVPAEAAGMSNICDAPGSQVEWTDEATTSSGAAFSTPGPEWEKAGAIF